MPVPVSQLSASIDPLRRRARKGKRRAGKAGTSIPGIVPDRDMDRAWWLDLSSPTPQDMRAIGKLLQIHPLTLEDILTQDPREKFELFPSLGYYFIAFRTIETLDEGIVGIVNVYLVVFREGVCSFHFADISGMLSIFDASLNRVQKLDDPATMSPDWIAHGIMDSIVDSFFPFLEDIEKEVAAIESLVFTTNITGSFPEVPSLSESSSSVTVVMPTSKSQKSLLMSPLKIKQEDTIHSAGAKTHFSLPQRPRHTWRLIGSYFRGLRDMVQSRFARPPASAPTAKSEVVTQLKKRLLKTGESGLGEGMGDEQDVFIYMGDVQDHILTLQQALAHYERMLSQSHPTYLSELRLAVSKTKSGADKAIVFLSVISMGVLCVQTIIGLNSMNVHIPGNRIPGGSYRVFIIVVALSVIITIIYGAIVRMWWMQAKRKRVGRQL
ncbi:hypothetical protein EUX98_g119 [Antrodiella citrinella]|uniref:Magnesium transporter n=1 Tax=Antrodiella citrinella TaxID=2447956 RepID=A0A4S4N529_9APHY|nr:hypothetical protein EUX98_g119 [Antrodiella citrinella]